MGVRGDQRFWSRDIGQGRQPSFRSSQRNSCRVIDHPYPSLLGHQRKVEHRGSQGVRAHQQQVESANIDVSSGQLAQAQPVGQLGLTREGRIDNVGTRDHAPVCRHLHAGRFNEPDRVSGTKGRLSEVRGGPGGSDDRRTGNEHRNLHEAVYRE